MKPGNDDRPGTWTLEGSRGLGIFQRKYVGVMMLMMTMTMMVMVMMMMAMVMCRRPLGHQACGVPYVALCV